MEGTWRELTAMLQAEIEFVPTADYMLTVQGGRVQPWMRRDLVDWLQEVIHFYKYHSETLALAVNYLDRFLSAQPISVQHLQLTGTTCLLLAIKLKERKIPPIAELVAMSAGAYSREDVKFMERLILHSLTWRMDAVTPHLYVYKMLPLCGIQEDCAQSIIKYTELVLEVILLEYQFARWKPSVLGATAILCAMGFLKILSPDYVVRITQAINAPLHTLQECSRNAMKLFAEAFPSFEMPGFPEFSALAGSRPQQPPPQQQHNSSINHLHPALRAGGSTNQPWMTSVRS